MLISYKFKFLPPTHYLLLYNRKIAFVQSSREITQLYYDTVLDIFRRLLLSDIPVYF